MLTKALELVQGIGRKGELEARACAASAQSCTARSTMLLMIRNEILARSVQI